MNKAAWLMILALGGTAASAETPRGEETYYVGHEEKFINVTFESHADVETILGNTHTARGKMSVDLDKGTGTVYISVPVATMRTGVDVRDEHLRSKNWLDAEAFPNISFEGKRSKPAEGKKDVVEVTGTFIMHGRKKEMTLPVEWKKIPRDASQAAGFGKGAWVRFRTEFEVKLSDFDVKVPDGIVAKVQDTWKVKMTLFASTENPF